MNEVDFYLMDLESKFKKIDFDKYYLSYSGGKDSHFLYWFIKDYLQDTRIKIVGVNTYMEHPDILKRILKNCDKVLIPKMKPFEIKEKYGIPCFSKQQDFFIYYYQQSIANNKNPAKSIYDRVMGTNKSWYNLSNVAKEYVLSGNAHKISHKCCDQLKKKPFADFEKRSGKKAILGVRSSESKMRSAQYKSCFQKNGKFTPIHDLSDELMDKIYEKYDIEIPQVYNYVSRTGCMGCPYGSYKKETQKDLDMLSLNKYNFVVKLFKESYDVLGIKYKFKQENKKG